MPTCLADLLKKLAPDLQMRNILNLVPQLLKATENGKLHWQAESVSRSYVCSLGGRFVRIFEWTDDEAEVSGLTAQLRQDLGWNADVLDGITASSFASDYETLRELHLAARRSAHNVDAVIDELEKTLSRL